MSIFVANKLPSINLVNKLAIIGDSPSRDDTVTRLPFSGYSGNLITGEVRGGGILLESCYLGNVRQQPWNYDKDSSPLITDPVLQGGKEVLRRDLHTWRPNCVLLSGPEALRSAGVEFSVSDYRGSLFTCQDTNSPFYGLKCIATFDPNSVIKNWEYHPLLKFDIARAVKESTSPDLILPQRIYDVELTADQIISKLDEIQDGTLVSVDIEGGIPNPEATKPEHRFPGGISCISVATDPLYAFIIAPLDYADSEVVRIFKALTRVLGSESIPKVLQNSLYDNFVLSWLWKMPIRNVRHDTMLSCWEIYPELPKGLATQTSIWTREPFYKNLRKINDKLTHYRYCCTDACVTYEIAQKHQLYFNTKPKTTRDHYDFNMSLLPACNYMELRGFRYDVTLAKEKLAETELAMSQLSALIDSAAGLHVNPNCNAGTNSLANVLYKKIGLEPQYKKVRGRKTDKTTADADALLNLLKKTDNPIVLHLLKWRALEGVRKQLMTVPDADGRMRCGYNLVGTETGRMSCYESPTGTGTNLTTITKKLRCLYQADPGMTMFQCDLSGADGWTVAAHCVELGDSTMWNDYMYGSALKPAKILAGMYEAQKAHQSISMLSRDELAKFLTALQTPSWLYEACKAVQHGSNYLMGEITMSANLLKQSWKKNHEPVYVSSRDCKALQYLYLNQRYIGVPKWHEWVAKQIRDTGQLGCASGHVRNFFGRRNDNSTIQAACAHEPQANTTYVTNLAMQRLWTDPENRRPDNTLIIEPLHQVHDALVGQFPTDLSTVCIPRIREYFNNKIRIANIDLVIPFEGGLGTDWGTLPTAL